MEFEFNLESNIFKLYRDLEARKYRHGQYSGFYICDPKVRRIHKASVRDRIVHHAVFRIVSTVFEPTFIQISFSCRLGKGNHRGVLVLEKMLRKVSQNNTQPCYVLKCDVKKFFDTVDHDILIALIEQRVKDEDAQWLIREIIGSYTSRPKKLDRKGIPIGNLTSQLFANVYMNELDQFIKHKLKVKYYARYTDDFVIVANTKAELEGYLPRIEKFLSDQLCLSLHPDKISILPYHRGIDFLGHVLFPHHKLLRTKTKRRIFRDLEKKTNTYNNAGISEETLHQSLQSYVGLLTHVNAHKETNRLKNQYWFNRKSSH